MKNPAVEVISQGGNNLFVFGLDAGKTMVRKSMVPADSSGWLPPTGISSVGGRFDSVPAAVVCAPPRVDVFALGLDDQMFHGTFLTLQAAAPMVWTPIGGVFHSQPAVASWGPNRLDIFALGTDNAMYHKALNGDAWLPSPSGWESLGGEFTSAPAVVSWGPNRLDIFGLGTDNAMYHKAWDGNNWLPSPSGWENLGGKFTSAPAAVAWGPNRLDIFALGTDNAMYHKAWGGTAWLPSASGWEDLGGTFDSQPAVASWGPNRLDIFALGTDDAMYHKAWSGTAWLPSPSAWEALGGTFASAPSATAGRANRLDIFGLGTDNALFHKAWSGTAWLPSPSGWESLGGALSIPRPTQQPPLPSQVDFDVSSITFTNGVPVGGSAHLTLFQNGTSHFSGHFHDSGATSYKTACVCIVKGTQNDGYMFQHAGSVAGSLEPGSRDDPWDVTGPSNPAIVANWSSLAFGSSVVFQSSADLSVNLASLVSSAETAIGDIQTLVEVIQAATA